MIDPKKLKEMPEPDERFFQEGIQIQELAKKVMLEALNPHRNFIAQRVQQILGATQSFIEYLATKVSSYTESEWRKRRVAGLENNEYTIYDDIVVYLTAEGRDHCIQEHSDVSIDDFEELQDGIYILKLPKGGYRNSCGHMEITVKGYSTFEIGRHNIIRIEGSNKPPNLWQNRAYNWSGEPSDPEEIQEQERHWNLHENAKETKATWVVYEGLVP